MNTVTGHYFDTVNMITADCSEALLQGCMKLCARYESLLSKTRPGSDIWNINHAGGWPVPVDDETRFLLRTSLEMYEASSGAFNIAVGGLMDVWSFRQAAPRVPEESRIRAALEACDLRRMELNGDFVRVPEGMALDLGGIAKGYIADRVGERLKEAGVESALLNFGGNIVAIGPKPDGSPWMIGLQTPNGTWGQDYWAVTELHRGTIVTSGIYERGFDLEGKRYHHILDPRTGWPAQSGLISVTIRGGDSMLADALATAVLVMGSEPGIQLAAAHGFEALTIDEQRNCVRSSGFQIFPPEGQ